MSCELLREATGRRRSPAAMPGHNAGHAPRNKGHAYPADPPTVDEIVAVMRQTPPGRHGLRLRALIADRAPFFDADAEGVPGFRSHTVSITLGVAAAEICAAQRHEGTVAFALRRRNSQSAPDRTRSGPGHV
jgi:hypothetical protein